MKQLFSYVMSVMMLSAGLMSCVEGTDVSELYKEKYSPNFEFNEGHSINVKSTATSVTFNLKFDYASKVKQVLCTIGQDADSVSHRLGRTLSFSPLGDGHHVESPVFTVDSLMPATKYYCNVFLQDYADQLHEGFTCDLETQSLVMTVDQDDDDFKLLLFYKNVGTNSKIGYRIGYEADLSDAKTRWADASNSLYGEPTSYCIPVDVSRMVPLSTYYVQQMVAQGGHTFYGDIVPLTSNYYTMRVSVEAGINQANIIVWGTFSYADIDSQGFNVGFYFAEHPITEDNLGERYDTPMSYYETETKISNLTPGTDYYVRPFIAAGSRKALFDECHFTTRRGFEGEVCDIDFYSARRNKDKAYNVRFVRVEPGTFTMGATPAQVPYAEADEYPAHEVTIDYPFYICETEFTEGMLSVAYWWTGEESTVAARLTYSNAQELIERMNSELNLKGLRLPTEAEWEYAARGGHKADGDWLYAGSDDYGEVGFYGAEVSANRCLRGKEVKTKKPNALGLYDMSGNAGEWCSDRYDADYYAESPALNPTGSRFGDDHVVRGGDLSPYRPDTDRRVSNRWHSNDYFEIYTGEESPLIGLRLVYDPRLDE